MQQSEIDVTPFDYCFSRTPKASRLATFHVVYIAFGVKVRRDKAAFVNARIRSCDTRNTSRAKIWLLETTADSSSTPIVISLHNMPNRGSLN